MRSIGYRRLEDASKYKTVRGPLTVTSTWKPKVVQILGPELLKLGNWTENERLRNLCHEIFMKLVEYSGERFYWWS